MVLVLCINVVLINPPNTEKRNLTMNFYFYLFTFIIIIIIFFLGGGGGGRFSKVLITFRARKTVLCMPCMHSRSKFQQFLK